MQMMGIIFSNIFDESLGELSARRTLASIPFGGRYRLIDFVMSNMVNSGITNVGVITKQNYQSLMDHLGSGKEWDLDRKVDGLFILPPFGVGQKSIYRGKIEALLGVLRFLERSNEEYVLLSDSNNICNIDFRDMLKRHIKSGAEISIITKKETIRGSADIKDLVIRSNMNGEVVDALIQYKIPGVADCGMGMYIMRRQFLIELLEEARSYSLIDFEREIIQAKHSYIKMANLEFAGRVLRINHVTGYFEANMALLSPEIRDEIFFKNGPVYTKIRDEVPTRYEVGSTVKNSLIADGCVILGEVENSVLFRGVKVGKGACVKNSVLMQETEIEENVVLDYVIADKDVTVSKDRLLMGAPEHQIIIGKGKRV
ncbi:MAG: glucose-1-phosphate adenylyltransferase subunit GlgD [Clostridia bacterium]|nr:glucose-1-phosphate adenylyltransferase subunit GlgD [Clostridia bacterium]